MSLLGCTVDVLVRTGVPVTRELLGVAGYVGFAGDPTCFGYVRFAKDDTLFYFEPELVDVLGEMYYGLALCHPALKEEKEERRYYTKKNTI